MTFKKQSSLLMFVVWSSCSWAELFSIIAAPSSIAFITTAILLDVPLVHNAASGWTLSALDNPWLIQTRWPNPNSALIDPWLVCTQWPCAVCTSWFIRYLLLNGSDYDAMRWYFFLFCWSNYWENCAHLKFCDKLLSEFSKSSILKVCE